MTRLRPPCLCDLYAGSTGTDDSTLLAFNRNLLIRPERRVMNYALELVDAWPVWDIPLCSESGTDDQIFSFRSPAVRSLDRPSTFVGVELCINDDAFEGGLALDVDDSVAGVKVVAEVMVVWVVVWPVVSIIC